MISKSTASSGRSNRVRQARIKAIHSTIELLNFNSFDELSVESIAVHAGFSRRTFFRYFSSKEDLVFAWVDGVAETVAEDIAGETEKLSPRDCLEKAMLRLAEKFEADRFALKPLTRALYDSPSLRGRMLQETIDWENQWSLCLQEKFGESDQQAMYFRVVTATVMSAYIVGIRSWAESQSELSAVEHIRHLFLLQRQM